MNQEEILELRSSVQKFIRLFGLLEQTVTPCGYKLSPSQVFALQELEDKTLTIGDLAEKLLLERSSVSRLVDALVKGGFVNRSSNEENRREVLLSLTEKGMSSLQKLRERSIQYYRSILNGVPEVEQQQILTGFNSFINALSKERSDINEL